MSMLLDRKDDGSMAFFLDGDLQFDSQDEHIYHEGLALPALALAESRRHDSITALIIGGGDGLTARELLKSNRISKVDLVDYDAKILGLARSEFSQLNQDSLADSRMNISVEDAREFIKRALESGTTYDVIVSDLTAAHDADGAQLHNVEFYDSLRGLLGEDGVLAVNTASPSGTPEAYWSIFNSMLATSLNPRPYRIFLPSFAEQGYGVDWGFILASPKLITGSDIDQLVLVEPRQTIKDVEQLRDLFSIPTEVFDRQRDVCAGSNGSDILVHYLFNADPVEEQPLTLIDTLSIDLTELDAPQQSGSHLLPQELQSSLAQWQEDPAGQEAIMEKVFELMPALRRFQTREMIVSFLSKPAAFLAPIDLGALVNELLKRAAELPGKLVQELIYLKDKIVEFAEDRDRLFALGLRPLAIIAVVVVIGNLMYPDSVYAKGEGGHAGGGHADAGHGAAGHGAAGHGAAGHGAAGHTGTGSHTGNHAAHEGGGDREGGGHVYGGMGAGHVYGGGTNTVNTVNTVTTPGGHWGPWFTNTSGKRVRNWVH